MAACRVTFATDLFALRGGAPRGRHFAGYLWVGFDCRNI